MSSFVRKRHQELLKGRVMWVSGRESGRRISHSSSCSSYIGWSCASSSTTSLPCTDSPMRPCEENALIKERGYCFFWQVHFEREVVERAFWGQLRPVQAQAVFIRAAHAASFCFFFRIRDHLRRHRQLRLVGGPMTPKWSRNRHVMFHPLSCLLFTVGSRSLDIGCPRCSGCILPSNDRT